MSAESALSWAGCWDLSLKLKLVTENLAGKSLKPKTLHLLWRLSAHLEPEKFIARTPHMLAKGCLKESFSLSIHMCAHGKAWHLSFLNAKSGKFILFFIPVCSLLYLGKQSISLQNYWGAAYSRDKKQENIVSSNFFLYSRSSLFSLMSSCDTNDPMSHSHLGLTAAKPKLVMLPKVQQLLGWPSGMNDQEPLWVPNFWFCKTHEIN